MKHVDNYKCRGNGGLSIFEGSEFVNWFIG
jgi:hypothetical protein